MVNLYFYIPSQIADEVVFSGLSLSKWANREGYISGGWRKCIATLLNPKDDMQLYESTDHMCLKITAPHTYCKVADNYLFEAGKDIPDIMDMYWKNVIPVMEYKFGTFIKPEALIMATVIPGRVTFANKKADSITLTGDNRELYLCNHLEALHTVDSDLNNKLLYHYFKNAALTGGCTEYCPEDTGGKTIFINAGGSYVTLDKPE